MTIYEYEQKVKAMTSHEILAEEARLKDVKFKNEEFAVNKRDICEAERKKRLHRAIIGMLYQDRS